MRADSRYPGLVGGGSSPGWEGPLSPEEVSGRHCGAERQSWEPHLSQLSEKEPHPGSGSLETPPPPPPHLCR